MKRTLLVVMVLVLVGGIVYIAIAHPDLIKNTWLWAVGFAGLIYSGLQRFFKLFSSEGDLKAIEQRNDQLKLDLERLRAEIKAADERLARERAELQRTIVRLEARLDLERRQYEQTANELERLKTMNYREYFESLPAEERERLSETAWGRVDFGL